MLLERVELGLERDVLAVQPNSLREHRAPRETADAIHYSEETVVECELCGTKEEREHAPDCNLAMPRGQHSSK
jgi:hypothetical protein